VKVEGFDGSPTFPALSRSLTVTLKLWSPLNEQLVLKKFEVVRFPEAGIWVWIVWVVPLPVTVMIAVEYPSALVTVRLGVSFPLSPETVVWMFGVIGFVVSRSTHPTPFAES